MLHSHVLSDWCVADSVCRSGETSLAAVGAAATAVQARHVYAVQVIVRRSRAECGRSLIAILLLRPSDKLAQVKHVSLGQRGGKRSLLSLDLVKISLKAFFMPVLK